MVRYTFMFLLVLGIAAPARANGFAEGLFEEFSFDFGAVPRGQLLVHPFRIVNNSKSTVRISSVRASCGCTAVRTLQNVLAPGQETAVIAQMDSRLFSGVRVVQIYVQFDSPMREEVRLAVQANSRSELIFSPESLNFGKVKRGVSPTAQMTITLLGTGQFVVSEVKCDSNYIQAKAQEVRRENGEVTYQVSAQVRPDIPEGKWFTDVWLTTNNPIMQRLRLPLNIEVEPAPAATSTPPSPAPGAPKGGTTVDLGQIKMGTVTDRKVVLRGAQPFRITSVSTGADKDVVAQPIGTEVNTVHVLTLTFRPGQPGTLSRTIRVQTDMNNSKEIEFNAQAQIVP